MPTGVWYERTVIWRGDRWTFVCQLPSTESISKFQLQIAVLIFLRWAIFVQIPVWQFKGWLCTATDLVVDLAIKLRQLALLDLQSRTKFCEISLRIVNSPALPSSVGLSWHSGIPSTAQVAPASTQCREVRQSATRLDSSHLYVAYYACSNGIYINPPVSHHTPSIFLISDQWTLCNNDSISGFLYLVSFFTQAAKSMARPSVILFWANCGLPVLLQDSCACARNAFYWYLWYAVRFRLKMKKWLKIGDLMLIMALWLRNTGWKFMRIDRASPAWQKVTGSYLIQPSVNNSDICCFLIKTGSEPQEDQWQE